MVSRLLVTFGALVWGLGVPYLEINDTHVFNPDWTPHALIHEVWQLFTNTGLAGFAIWLAWAKDEVIQGAIVGLFITGGFLAAFIIRNTYGGSMKYLDGSEKTVVGLNIGVLGFSIVAGGLIIAILLEKRRPA
ncbi:MAG: hypothetical protein NXH87_18415 [Rhodobiaceae bacterium]|nr:hypothetical protein [Rhodobiaceae bacterium]